MRSIVLSFAAFVCLFVLSCSKSSSNDGSQSGTFTINGISFKASSVYFLNNRSELIISNASGSTGSTAFLDLRFTSPPATDGTYTYTSGIGIQADDNTSIIYVGGASVAAPATLVLKNGKINFTLPDNWFIKIPAGTDSAKVSANVVQ